MLQALADISAYDWVAVLVTLFSVGMGLWRGMITESVALGSWVGAWVVARLLADPLSHLIERTMQNSALRLGLSFFLVFVLALILIRLAGRGLAKIASGAGLKPLDRLLGALFGAIRALVLLMVLVCLIGLTGLNQEADWKRAFLTGPLENMTAAALPLLPAGVAERVRLNSADAIGRYAK